MARTAKTKAGTKAGAATPVTEAETAAADAAQNGLALSQDDMARSEQPVEAAVETPAPELTQTAPQAEAEPTVADAAQDSARLSQDDMARSEQPLETTAETTAPELTETEAEPVAELPNLSDPIMFDVGPEPVARDAEVGDVEQEPEAVIAEPVTEPDPVPTYVPEPREPVEARVAMPIPSVLPHPVQARRGGVVPLLLGGVVAAGLGFGAAWYWTQAESGPQTAAVAAQAERIAALEAALAGLPSMPDLAPLEAQVAAIGPDMAQELAALDASVAAALLGFEERLAALERAPSEDGMLAQTAIEAWEREMDALRADVAAERDRMQQIADAADAQLAQTRVEATALVDDASETASAAVARAALSRVSAAIDAGTPFDAPLAELAAEGITLPDALSGVASEGVSSLAALSDTFPPAAREALATARREGLAGEEGGGFSAFLRSQFDVRSVTPRDGAGPDAALSRAEAALQANRLSDALAEVASLPEVARAEMSGWVAAADARLAALAAVQDLSQSLNQN